MHHLANQLLRLCNARELEIHSGLMLQMLTPVRKEVLLYCYVVVCYCFDKCLDFHTVKK